MTVTQYLLSVALHERLGRVEYRIFFIWHIASKTCKLNSLGRFYRAGTNKVNAFSHAKVFLNLPQLFWSYFSTHYVLYKNVTVPIT